MHRGTKRQQQDKRQISARLLKDQKSQTNWKLSSRRKTQDELVLLFDSLQGEVDVRSISSDWNRMPNIIKIISTPFFPRLKMLNLGANDLTTLQPIIKLRAENLEEIFLWNNHITDLRGLRKGNFPKLRLIDLSKNKIIELGKLPQGSFRNLQCLNLDMNQIACIAPVCKIKGFTFHGTLLAADSMLVAAFGVLTKKGRASATNFVFQNNLPPQVAFF